MEHLSFQMQEIEDDSSKSNNTDCELVLLNLAAVCERLDTCIGQLFICHNFGSNHTCELATANCFGD